MTRQRHEVVFNSGGYPKIGSVRFVRNENQHYRLTDLVIDDDGTRNETWTPIKLAVKRETVRTLAVCPDE